MAASQTVSSDGGAGWAEYPSGSPGNASNNGPNEGIWGYIESFIGRFRSTTLVEHHGAGTMRWIAHPVRDVPLGSAELRVRHGAGSTLLSRTLS